MTCFDVDSCEHTDKDQPEQRATERAKGRKKYIY